MGRVGKPKPVAGSQDNDHKENITWAGNLDTLYERGGYQEGWKPGRKVTCGKKCEDPYLGPSSSMYRS